MNNGVTMKDIIEQSQSVNDAIKKLQERLENGNKLREELDSFIVKTIQGIIDTTSKEFDVKLSQELKPYVSIESQNELKRELLEKINQDLKSYASIESQKKLKSDFETKLTETLKPYASIESQKDMKRYFEEKLIQYLKSYATIDSQDKLKRDFDTKLTEELKLYTTNFSQNKVKKQLFYILSLSIIQWIAIIVLVVKQFV